MLYLGIDKHHKQITVSIRDDQGTVILRQQVSTQPDARSGSAFTKGWLGVQPQRKERLRSNPKTRPQQSNSRTADRFANTHYTNTNTETSKLRLAPKRVRSGTHLTTNALSGTDTQ